MKEKGITRNKNRRYIRRERREKFKIMAEMENYKKSRKDSNKRRREGFFQTTRRMHNVNT